VCRFVGARPLRKVSALLPVKTCCLAVTQSGDRRPPGCDKAAYFAFGRICRPWTCNEANSENGHCREMTFACWVGQERVMSGHPVRVQEYLQNWYQYFYPCTHSNYYKHVSGKGVFLICATTCLMAGFIVSRIANNTRIVTNYLPATFQTRVFLNVFPNHCSNMRLSLLIKLLFFINSMACKAVIRLFFWYCPNKSIFNSG